MERMTAEEYKQQMNQKPSKYKAKRTEVDGRKFASRLEANYYCELKTLIRAGEVVDIQLQPVYPLPGGLKYIADFLVKYADGREEIVDCKGMRTAVYKLKKRLFEATYPNLKIVEVVA